MSNFGRNERMPDPTHEEIRVRRLELALEKLHEMKPGQIRDELILDFERVIAAVMKRATVQGSGGGGRRNPYQNHGAA